MAMAEASAASGRSTPSNAPYTWCQSSLRAKMATQAATSAQAAIRTASNNRSRLMLSAIYSPLLHQRLFGIRLRRARMRRRRILLVALRSGTGNDDLRSLRRRLRARLRRNDLRLLRLSRRLRRRRAGAHVGPRLRLGPRGAGRRAVVGPRPGLLR